MRIGITGAHGTGKTTLAQALAEKLGLPLIRETARTVADRMGIEDCDVLPKDPYLAADFEWQILKEQEYKEAKHQEFVSDRTYLDFLAYWRLYDCNKVTLSFITDVFAQFCRSGAARYDLIIYVPIEIDYDTTDAFRLSDKRTQNRIDEEILALLEQMDLQTVVCVSGTTEERVEKVLSRV